MTSNKKQSIKINDQSMILQYPPFSQSSIKKNSFRNRLFQLTPNRQDSSFNISYNGSPISCYKNPFHLIQDDTIIKESNHSDTKFSRNQQNRPQQMNNQTNSQINNLNTIQNQEELEELTIKQIDYLEQTINQKLNYQFNLISTKIKQKQKLKQHLLKQYRQNLKHNTEEHISKISQVENNSLVENSPYIQNKQNTLNLDQTQQYQKWNPLNSKRIKNKIIRPIQDNQQNVNYYFKNINRLSQRKSFDNHFPFIDSSLNQSLSSSSAKTPIFVNSSRNQYQTSNRTLQANQNKPISRIHHTIPFSQHNVTQNQQHQQQVKGPNNGSKQFKFLYQKVKYRQVVSQSRIDTSLIKQMSDQLKKMQFKNIQKMALGRFDFLKKRQR